REDGFSNVSVFDGEVEVLPLDSEEKRLLSEGEAVRVGRDAIIEDVGFDLKRFEKLWPIESGIAGSSETIRFIPPWPRRIRFVQSDETIFVATEGRRTSLQNALRLNISKPGEYLQANQLTPDEVAAGRRVRSFILHYSPTEQVGFRRAARLEGSVTFDRPVLGLIVQQEELLASSRLFTNRSAGEGQRRRELQLTGGADGDRISLSEDRRTLSLDLISPGRSSDLVRVIVDASPLGKENRK
ncbi:MAG: iron dicitrate transport regulator FecR, partial [Planctomycetota bacterium]